MTPEKIELSATENYGAVLKICLSLAISEHFDNDFCKRAATKFIESCKPEFDDDEKYLISINDPHMMSILKKEKSEDYNRISAMVSGMQLLRSVICAAITQENHHDSIMEAAKI